MTNTHVLVTGSNQGIGKGILERYLARPNHTVIAAIPDPSHPTSVALQELPKGEGSQLLVVKVDPLIYEDAAAAATRLQTDHSIDHLDIVVANATLPNVRPAIEDVEVPELQAHLDVNLYGLVAMYHAVRDLLKQSSREPIWVTVGSSVAREQ
jgi:NAD(P)-dependent dehydrogenase (short-subunit alcohol dehydrogenase family)